MKTLDLHGTKHQKASDVVRDFLNFADLPCQIITGNSAEMKAIVREIVKEYEWFCYEKNSYNQGTLVILEETLW